MNLVISEEASEGILSIASFIAENFSIDRAIKFQVDLVEALELLQSFPESSPVIDVTRNPSLRKRVFQKKTIILYRLKDKNNLH
jgi:plasmid stabilization system protein ParE